MDKIIPITWKEWKTGREARRETLRKLGLDATSRRSASSSDKHLRKAFGGTRVPDFSASPREPHAALVPADHLVETNPCANDENGNARTSEAMVD